MARLKDFYVGEAAPALMKKFSYKSVMQIPKLDKIVINVGAGEARENSKAIDAISEQKAEGDVESLFNSTETTALQGDCSHIDSFELVAFFVVKEAVS